MMSISLTKGQRISLEKDTGEAYHHIILGLGWDVRKRKKLFALRPGITVDLDAAVGLFDAQGNLVDQVWFQQLECQDGALRHSGGQRGAVSKGSAAERIEVRLDRLPLTVQTLVLVLTSYAGDTFDQVQRACCRLVDATHDREVAHFVLDSKGPHTALVMLSLYRANDDWALRAIGEGASGRTLKDLVPYLHHYL